MQEFLKTLGFNHLVQDRFATFTAKLDFFAQTFDPLFEPTCFFWVRDVHVLQGKCTAVGAFHDGQNFAHGCDLQTQYVVDENRAIHVSIGKAV